MTLTAAIRSLKADFEGGYTRSERSQQEQDAHELAARVKGEATPSQYAFARAQVAREDRWDVHYPANYVAAMRQIGRADLAEPVEARIEADEKLIGPNA